MNIYNITKRQCFVNSSHGKFDTILKLFGIINSREARSEIVNKERPIYPDYNATEPHDPGVAIAFTQKSISVL